MRLKAIVVGFAIALQLAVLGPVDMIPRNVTELGLGIGDVLGTAIAIGLGLGAVLTAIVLLSQRYGYMRVASTLAAVGVYLYLQYHLLVPDLGVFDGRSANFSGLGRQIALELSIMAGLLAAALLRPAQSFKAMAPLLGILAVAETAVVGASAMARPPMQHSAAQATKADLVSSNFFWTAPMRTRGIPELSTRNVIVILLDTLQADLFEQILRSNSDIEKGFGGFTVYRNAAGVFPFTGMSVATLLTGTRYDGREKIPAYLERIAPRQLAARFDALGYEVDLLPLGSRSALVEADLEACRRIVATYDFALLRQVPTLLKQWQYNEARFRLVQLCGVRPVLKQELDPIVLERIIADTRVSRPTRPSFKFIHLYAMHPPGKLRDTCEVREQPLPEMAAVVEQATCILRQVQRYLDRMRALGVFDGSMVIVTADHGTLYGLGRGEVSAPGVPARVISSAHPTIAFKDFGASGAVRFSDAPASLLDVYPTIAKRVGMAIGDAPGRDLASLGEDERRYRDFFFYRQAIEITNRDFVKQSYWLANRGNITDPADWGATVSAADGASVHLVDPWLKPEGARILLRLPSVERLPISAQIMSAGRDQAVRLVVNRRLVASWPLATGTAIYDAVADLHGEEQGLIATIELLPEAPSSGPEGAATAKEIRVEFVKIGDPVTAAPPQVAVARRSITASFGKRGSSDVLIKEGWKPPYDAGRNTDGPESSMSVHVGDHAASRVLRLKARAIPGTRSRNGLPVELVVNGRQLAAWEIVRATQWYEALIPAGTANAGMLDVRLKVKDPEAPPTAAEGGIAKPASIAVFEMVIEEAEN